VLFRSEELNAFFGGFFGKALKGNTYLSRALLTGIQRVLKESIFSKLNHIFVYTVMNEQYADYFGLNTKETADLLQYYDMELSEEVKAQYDGYQFGKIEMYNPWSILCYVSSRKLESYWVNSSSNYLVRNAIANANSIFMEKYTELIYHGIVEVDAKLETSFIELNNPYTLWGLLINAGYLTVTEESSNGLKLVRIPNGEVRSEFQNMIADQANMDSADLQNMFRALLQSDMNQFLEVYRKLVLSCTSCYDAKENAYHMLFLGMCISLQSLYKISSNMESGYGRSDITLESRSGLHPHIIIEFKQGKELERLKHKALRQIIDKRYYTGLSGKILCIGIAHDQKRCELVYEEVRI
jgi:hypothetical protein